MQWSTIDLLLIYYWSCIELLLSWCWFAFVLLFVDLVGCAGCDDRADREAAGGWEHGAGGGQFFSASLPSIFLHFPSVTLHFYSSSAHAVPTTTSCSYTNDDSPKDTDDSTAVGTNYGFIMKQITASLCIFIKVRMTTLLVTLSVAVRSCWTRWFFNRKDDSSIEK